MTQILQIHQFLFNEKPFEIYGTEDEPLFLVNDIICGILGFEKISWNNFFIENKENPDIVISCQFDRCSVSLQERFKRRKNEPIYFLTEFGMYMCLMRSNKQVAIAFQFEVFMLLKNLHRGILSLHVNKTQEYEASLATITA